MAMAQSAQSSARQSSDKWRPLDAKQMAQRTTGVTSAFFGEADMQAAI